MLDSSNPGPARPAGVAQGCRGCNGGAGRIYILFANVGIQGFKSILEMEDADWHDQLDVNLTGTANVICAFAPHVVAGGQGRRIIVTSGTQERHGTRFGSAYSAFKWGIIGLMKSAGLDLGEHGITVNAVVPGLIDAPLTRHHERLQHVDRRPESGARRAELGGVTLVGLSRGGGEVARYMSRHGGAWMANAVLVSAVTPCLVQGPDNPDGVPRATFDAMIEGLQKDHPNFLRRSRSSSSAPGC